jgi:hypothetical protein
MRSLGASKSQGARWPHEEHACLALHKLDLKQVRIDATEDDEQDDEAI